MLRGVGSSRRTGLGVESLRKRVVDRGGMEKQGLAVLSHFGLEDTGLLGAALSFFHLIILSTLQEN